MSNKSLKKITFTAVFAALAFVFQILEFSLPFVPSFLKFDFSDFPALVVSFAYGPAWGVMVELLKNLAHCPLSHTNMVGELANFLVGAAIVCPAGLIYKFFKTRRGAVIASLSGAFFATAVSFPVNMFITYPFYSAAYFGGSTEKIVEMYTAIFPSVDTLTKALLLVNVPFTLIKGLICSLITFVTYKRISKLIK